MAIRSSGDLHGEAAPPRPSRSPFSRRAVPHTTSLTLTVEALPGRQAVRADARCAECGSSLRVPSGIYVIRLTLDDEMRLVRGSVRRLADGGEWSFASGTELAKLVTRLGHQHA